MGGPKTPEIPQPLCVEVLRATSPTSPHAVSATLYSALYLLVDNKQLEDPKHVNVPVRKGLTEQLEHREVRQEFAEWMNELKLLPFF